MNRERIFILAIHLSIAVSTLGCVPKSQYEATSAELVSCRKELDASDDAIAEWRGKYEWQLAQWEEAFVERDGSPAATLDLVEGRFQEIAVSLPPMVRAEVEANLQELAAIISAEFLKLQRTNARLSQQMTEAGDRLDEIGREMVRGEDLDDLEVAEESRRRHLRALAERTSALVERIQDFDRTRLHCKSCPQFLSLKRKKSAEIARFHDELVREISKLQRDVLSSEPALR